MHDKYKNPETHISNADIVKAVEELFNRVHPSPEGRVALVCSKNQPDDVFILTRPQKDETGNTTFKSSRPIFLQTDRNNNTWADLGFSIGTEPDDSVDVVGKEVEFVGDENYSGYAVETTLDAEQRAKLYDFIGDPDLVAGERTPEMLEKQRRLVRAKESFATRQRRSRFGRQVLAHV